ncbi:hypothetical protein ACA910_014501 [Epithemia clementina (nom. ined.)]
MGFSDFTSSNLFDFYAFHATLKPLGDSGVEGNVVLFADGPVVAYAGKSNGLEVNLGPSECTAVNGCGAHVHQGISCEAELQEGHYYMGNSDPWLTERYSSNDLGVAKYNGVVDIGGTGLLDGRAFIVHAANGTRVACGLLKPLALEEATLFHTQTQSLSADGDGGVSSAAVLAAGIPGFDNGQVCFYGRAKGLEANLTTFLEGGTHCTSTNGCGVHVHEGFSCAPEEQLGHFYNQDSVAIDPWLLVGYEMTTNDGDAFFADCVETGIENPMDMKGRAVIVHANDGSRTSCGILTHKNDTQSSGASILRRFDFWLGSVSVGFFISLILLF